MIGVHRAKYYKRQDGLALGPGPFVSALEHASGVKAECVGKPEPSFFKLVLEDMDCRVEETVMIGDVSLRDILYTVLTGIFRLIPSKGIYDGIFHSIAYSSYFITDGKACIHTLMLLALTM